MPDPTSRATYEAIANVVDRIAEAVSVVDRDGTRLHANAAAEAIFADLREGSGARPLDVPWGAVDEHWRAIPNAELPAEITRRSGHEVDEQLVGLPRRDGTTAWLRVSTRRLSAGRPPHQVVVSFADVSERYAQALALEEAEERFRLSFDDAPIGLALVDLDGSWLRVNRALCDMTGYGEEELLATTFQQITHPDDLEADLELVRRVIAGEIRSYEMEKRYFRADGSIVCILLSVSLVRDRGGEPRYLVSHIQDISERKRHERELRHLSEHDALTGLPNRRALAAELTRRLADQRRHGHPFALALLDLDNFKDINDSLGHTVGDRLLRAVADELRARLRATDLVARLGGDEFACVLAHTGRAAAESVAAELVECVRAVRVRDGDHELRVSASVGVACAADGATVDEDRILAAADVAMYAAKDAGRDRYALHAAGIAG